MPLDEIDEALTRAVRDTLTPATSVQVAARAICQLNGPKPGCYCGRGQWARCHAVELYGDFAVASVLALRKAGIIAREVGDAAPLNRAQSIVVKKRAEASG